MRKVIYGVNVYDIEDNNLSGAQIQASMSELFPELKNATFVEDKEAGTITFTVKAGTKGMARKVVYGVNVYDIEDDNLSGAQIQASMSELFPELKNATFVENKEEGTITFTVKAGTKGMARKVIYGVNVYDIEDDNLSGAQIQASMSELFPELKNATFVEDKEAGTVTFTVKAGTKGMARKVIYGVNVYDIEDDNLSGAQIQASMSELFPELKNATFVEDKEAGTVTFTVKAGTKGMARKVIYGVNVYDIEDDNLSGAQIQASMSELFPELKNATFVEDKEAGTVTFTVKAGTKGAAYIKMLMTFAGVTVSKRRDNDSDAPIIITVD